MARQPYRVPVADCPFCGKAEGDACPACGGVNASEGAERKRLLLAATCPHLVCPTHPVSEEIDHDHG